jgi:hypothetical protein
MALAGALALPSTAVAQLENPTDWTWRLDTPATLVTSLDVPANAWLFVMMPPGWHVTTGPGALLFPSTLSELGGNFSLESQIFLFPGTAQDEYGVFIGGTGLAGDDPAEYTAFVIRRDGQAAVLARTRAGARTVAAWRSNTAIVPHAGGSDPVKNVLRVDVDPATVSFVVNGAKVLEVPRADIRSAGRVGFRIGPALNLHITSLDVTQRLAPARKQAP